MSFPYFPPPFDLLDAILTPLGRWQLTTFDPFGEFFSAVPFVQGVVLWKWEKCKRDAMLKCLTYRFICEGIFKNICLNVGPIFSTINKVLKI